MRPVRAHVVVKGQKHSSCHVHIVRRRSVSARCSRRLTANQPYCGRAQHERKCDEGQGLVPLKRPVTTRWLKGKDLSVLLNTFLENRLGRTELCLECCQVRRRGAWPHMNSAFQLARDGRDKAFSTGQRTGRPLRTHYARPRLGCAPFRQRVRPSELLKNARHSSHAGVAR
jgi:hypothetical protein